MSQFITIKSLFFLSVSWISAKESRTFALSACESWIWSRFAWLSIRALWVFKSSKICWKRVLKFFQVALNICFHAPKCQKWCKISLEMLTMFWKDSQGCLMKVQYVLVHQVEQIGHLGSIFKYCLILQEKGQVLSKLLVSVKQNIKRVCPWTCDLPKKVLASHRLGLWVTRFPTWRQNFIGPQTKHRIDDALRKTSMTLPYCSIASRNAWTLGRCIIVLRRPCSSCMLLNATRTSSINANWKSSSSFLLRRNENSDHACLNGSCLALVSTDCVLLLSVVWERELALYIRCVTVTELQYVF